MASRPRTPSTPAKADAPPSLDAVASQLDGIRSELQALNRRIDQLIGAVVARAPGGSDYAAGRDRDPGDAVPPGVAVQSPVPLEPGDEAALHELEKLPKRAPRRTRPG